MAHHDLVVTGLIKPLTALASRVQTVRNGKIPLFFAFDEVSNLAADGRLALAQVVRLLRNLPVGPLRFRLSRHWNMSALLSRITSPPLGA